MIHPYSHYLRRAAERWPDKTALREADRSLAYRELDERAGRLAAALLRLGVKPGERVAIVQENCTRYVEAVCAVARAGAVFVPMLGSLTEREHAYMVSDCGARVVIGLGEAGAQRMAHLAGNGLEFTGLAPGAHPYDYETLIAGNDPADPGIDREPSALGQILYTSGTTGKPKGVMHSYASTAAGIGAWVSALGIAHEDRLLGHFPMSHFGGRVMDSSICTGATLHILPRPDPALILEAIGRERITVLLVVPTLMQMILEDPRAQRSKLTSLRLVLYAAAPASPSLVSRARGLFGPVLATGFGQTEAYGLNTFLSPAEHEKALAEGGERLASIGREACAWVQVRLLSPRGEEVAVGEVGEICVCAPWVMAGYWGNPRASDRALKNGWLRTGDLARRDAAGYYYLADRKEDMIITGGYNVYPKEVEDAISSLAGVKEVCVIGIPDKKWGEAVTAVVVAEGLSEAAIIGHCRERLAHFKVPKQVKFVASLPKSAVGKILRRAVREPFWEGKERRVHGAE